MLVKWQQLEQVLVKDVAVILQ